MKSPEVLYMADEKHKCFPLHVACQNQYCPTSIIMLLFAKYPQALTKLCKLDGYGIFYDEYWDKGVKGTPLHYYISRRRNIDIEVVKLFIMKSPEVLYIADEECKCTPIHLFANQQHLREFPDVLTCLAEANPLCLCLVDGSGKTPMHIICTKKHVTAEVVKLFIKCCPSAVWKSYEDQFEGDSLLPIHLLCMNTGLSTETSIEILSLLLSVYPEVNRSRNGAFKAPIHTALDYMPNEFCKALLKSFPGCAREMDSYHGLPIHQACDQNDFEMVEFLVGIYPDSLGLRSPFTGMVPIHYAAAFGNVEMIKMLLAHDPDSISRNAEEAEADWYAIASASFENGLPFLFACYSDNDQRLDVIRLLYDIYPEAIYRYYEEDMGEDEEVVIWLTMELDVDEETRAFVEKQAKFAATARDMEAMTTLDDNGYLELHRGLCNGASLGSIKLLVNANPDALQIATHEGSYPIHLACQYSTVDVVEFLLGKYDGCLNAHDARGDYPLHIACREGNYAMVNILLQKPMAPVLARNSDNEIPVNLLFDTTKERNVDEKGTEYLETLWHMLLLLPDVVDYIQLIAVEEKKDEVE